VGGDVDGWCVVDARLIFCDFAEVSGGKLFISGAGISLVGTSEATPPFPLTAALALLITVPAADTGRPHRLTIELLAWDERGREERVEMTQTTPDTLPGEDGLLVHPFMVEKGPNVGERDEISVPLAVPLLQFPLPRLGGYTFSAVIDDVEMDRASFRLLPIQQAEEASEGPL
jgi:hypothetical protein